MNNNLFSTNKTSKKKVKVSLKTGDNIIIKWDPACKVDSCYPFEYLANIKLPKTSTIYGDLENLRIKKDIARLVNEITLSIEMNFKLNNPIPQESVLIKLNNNIEDYYFSQRNLDIFKTLEIDDDIMLFLFVCILRIRYLLVIKRCINDDTFGDISSESEYKQYLIENNIIIKTDCERIEDLSVSELLLCINVLEKNTKKLSYCEGFKQHVEGLFFACARYLMIDRSEEFYNHPLYCIKESNYMTVNMDFIKTIEIRFYNLYKALNIVNSLPEAKITNDYMTSDTICNTLGTILTITTEKKIYEQEIQKGLRESYPDWRVTKSDKELFRMSTLHEEDSGVNVLSRFRPDIIQKITESFSREVDVTLEFNKAKNIHDEWIKKRGKKLNNALKNNSDSDSDDDFIIKEKELINLNPLENSVFRKKRFMSDPENGFLQLIENRVLRGNFKSIGIFTKLLKGTIKLLFRYSTDELNLKSDLDYEMLCYQVIRSYFNNVTKMRCKLEHLVIFLDDILYPLGRNPFLTCSHPVILKLFGLWYVYLPLMCINVLKSKSANSKKLYGESVPQMYVFETFVYAFTSWIVLIDKIGISNMDLGKDENGDFEKFIMSIATDSFEGVDAHMKKIVLDTEGFSNPDVLFGPRAK